MQRMLVVSALVVALGGCSTGGSSPAASPAASVAIVSPTPAPTATATPTRAPTPSPVVVAARHIVTAIDQLDLLSSQGGDLYGWIRAEQSWATDNMSTIAIFEPAIRAYIDALLLLSAAFVDDTDTAAPVAAVIGTRNAVAKLAGLPAATPRPTPEPTPAPHTVGQAIEFSTSDASISVKVVAIKVWAGSTYNRPSSGKRWVTIDVLDTGLTGTLDDPPSYNSFTITDPDGYVYENVPPWRDPQLPYGSDFDSIKAGQKVRGWITFELPKTVKTGSVLLTDVDGGEWTFTGLK